MQHKLKISLASGPSPGEEVVSCRRVSIRERLLTRLLGHKEKVMILVPGESVESVDIAEVGGKGGASDEQD